ncbi:hypothetical protein CC1G_10268 [Coprinopsis cinerea okayama7|uniref:Small ribosomal subunit protein mS35 mitochondrial conserved domain-containing protein n=1 Tax=Coprinopsis cinerea (strain Okayama-7 / 130 / ATCC MYA-4618 / FGSC 9003) TaxID=240176 RepID=A8N147_COPC7|nr:hypothetical protein CC1G_10268 [Coprinopsis cinerea okayama7\|eukprot:XP_001828597.2 hypothetical protein CC1G_10268 [Coprinopsis cinerea okayama7\
MASTLTRSLGFSSLRVASSSSVTAAKCSTHHVLKRTFSVSSPALARRTKSVMEEYLTDDDLFTLMTEQENVTDSPVLGHKMLQAQREVLHYMRLIEHEMPKLVAYRQPFIPPSSQETPLVVRSIEYLGEYHPAASKRSITVAVDSLPLKDAKAIHKFKLIAGPRWTPNPPKDAGVCEHEVWQNGNGYFKISCDTFSSPEMNAKWASDALDRLIKEANEGQESFEGLPLDLRHVYSRSRKAKKGDHLRNRPLNPVSVKDFPKEWLPQSQPEAQTQATTQA